jgi:hypothetical protein
VEIKADCGVFNKIIYNCEFQKWKLMQITWSVIREVVRVKSIPLEWIFKGNQFDVIFRTSFFVCGASRWHFKSLSGLAI